LKGIIRSDATSSGEGRITLVFVGDAYEGEIRVGETLLIFQIEPTHRHPGGEEISLLRPASLFDPG